jgi:hypothetical protein
MKTDTTKFKRSVNLLFHALKRKAKMKFENFTKHEPMMKAEAVEKTLYLLRRDFEMEEQNDIMLSLIRRLHDKREADIIQLETKIEMMKDQTNKLKERVVITD